MNYYPFHIGDFAAHTSHLSWEEDIAYRRMLDWYYLNERALPSDPAKIARLVRMPKSGAAIQSVLDEFFTLSGDGWHNKRADEELAAMLSRQEQQTAKDAHESERMARYRARRASMFEALRLRGIVPAWDVPIKELQALFDANCNGPATDLQREQQRTCNADATAIPTPTPTPTPTPETKTARKRAAPAALVSVADLVGMGVQQSHAEDWLTARKGKSLPLTRTALEQTQAEAAKAGMTLAEAVARAAAEGWAGFKASWLQQPAQRNGAPIRASPGAAPADLAAETARLLGFAPAHDPNVIDA